MPKFQRKYKLTIRSPKTMSTDTNGEETFVDNSFIQIMEITEPLTIEFSISRMNFASAGTGIIRIYNLNPRQRDSIYKDAFDTRIFRQIKLEAGYENSPMSIALDGIILEAKSYKRGGEVNFITEIRCFDRGTFGMVHSACNISKAPGVSRNEVIRDLVDNLLVYNIGIGVIGDFPGTYPRGRVYAAYPTWNALKIETSGNCFMDNGKVYCMNLNDVYRGGISVINSESGLLSTPQRSDTGITIEILFEPALQIGQMVLLQSRALPKWNGEYKVAGIEHRGTISGAVNSSCRTTVELFSLKGGINFLNNSNALVGVA